MVDNPFVVPRSIVEQAMPIMLMCANNWPDDDWFSLGPDWDLNLYRDPDEKPSATIYPVVNFQTVTRQGHPLSPVNMMWRAGWPLPH